MTQSCNLLQWWLEVLLVVRRPNLFELVDVSELYENKTNKVGNSKNVKSNTFTTSSAGLTMAVDGVT